MHAIVRGASCTWLSVPTQTFPLAHAAESHTYNLKTVYKITTGRKCILCGNVSKLQYFNIYFPGENAPRPPSSSPPPPL